MTEPRKNPYSWGMRMLIKKILAYTMHRHNAGTIGPKRIKHTVRPPTLPPRTPRHR